MGEGRSEKLMKKKEIRQCIWKLHRDVWDEYWESGCGDKFVLTDGTPKANGMKYCPFCGKELDVKH